MSTNINNSNKTSGAGLGARLGAYIIDYMIVSAIFLLVAVVITMITGADMMMRALREINYVFYFPVRLIMISFPIVWFIYSVFMESGQSSATCGKKALKLKVVYKDGTNAKGLDVVVRNLIKNLVYIIPVLFFCPPQRFGLTWVNVRILSGVLIGVIIFILCAFIALCNSKHRGFHDILAGTLVVNELSLYAAQESTGAMVNNVNTRIVVTAPVAAQPVNIQTPQRPVSTSVSAPGQPVNIQIPQRPVSAPVPAPAQPVNIQTPQRSVSTPVSAPGQPVNIQIPQRPVSAPVPAPGQPVNIQIPQRPVSAPVPAPGQPVNIQTPQRPVSAPVPAPGQPVNIQTPQRPVSAPVSAPGQSVNIQTPKRQAVSVSAPVVGGTVNINIPSKAPVAPATEEPVDKNTNYATVKPTKLECLDGMYSGARFSLDRPVLMGLDSSVCSLIFRNDTEGVGRVHCRVEVLGEKAYLEDLGSGHATYANAKKLNAYERVELALGDCIKIGKNEIFIMK